MGVSSLSWVRHTCCIQEFTYPTLGLLVFWLYIFLGVCSLCVSWPLGSRLLEYIYALLSSGPFIFYMPIILSPVLGPSTNLGVILGGITAPYRAHKFENGHIPTPFIEDFYSLRSIFTPVVTLTRVVVDT